MNFIPFAESIENKIYFVFIGEVKWKGRVSFGLPLALSAKPNAAIEGYVFSSRPGHTHFPSPFTSPPFNYSFFNKETN